MSNPNPQQGHQKYGRLTYEQIQEINRKNGITIQGFPGIFENGTHTRFGKKICFDEFPSVKEMSAEWLKDTQDRFARTQREFNFKR